LYRGPNHVLAALQYTKHYKGPPLLQYNKRHMGTMQDSVRMVPVSLLQNISSLRVPPPQEIVTATRPVMKHVEIALEKQCGMTNLTARIKESCSRVKCPPIP
jgi:hypothetical protein